MIIGASNSRDVADSNRQQRRAGFGEDNVSFCTSVGNKAKRTRNVSSVSRAVGLIGASLCRATVIVEQPAEPLASANAAEIPCPCGNTLDQLVGQTLVIPLSVVMLDVLRDHPAEMTIAERP